MLLKDYVEYLTDLLDNNPECGELEVWTYSDEEGNSILPMYEGIDSAFVDKGVHREVDEYIMADELKDHLEYIRITLEDFNKTHKEVILL